MYEFEVLTSVSGLCIATDFVAERIGVRVPVSVGGFLVSEHVQTGSGAQQTSVSTDTGVLYEP
jgi:hypothetical protein